RDQKCRKGSYEPSHSMHVSSVPYVCRYPHYTPNEYVYPYERMFMCCLCALLMCKSIFIIKIVCKLNPLTDSVHCSEPLAPAYRHMRALLLCRSACAYAHRCVVICLLSLAGDAAELGRCRYDRIWLCI